MLTDPPPPFSSLQPCPPHHPIWGHLLIAKDCVEHFPPDTHPHVHMDFLRQKYNLGKFFYLDYWPADGQFLIITDPEVANQITTGSTLPKSPLEVDYITKLLGDQNMICLEGAAWKAVRAMFNPGFASGHLMTLVPYVVDATVVFGEVLAEKAESGEVFEMEELATRLTVDIIGKVTLDFELNTQRSEHPILTLFRRQVGLLPGPSTGRWESLTRWPIISLMLWYTGRQLDQHVGEALDQRYAKRTADEKSRPAGEGAGTRKKTRYSIDLALDTYEKQFQDPGKKTASMDDRLDPTFRRSAIDQFKTFIFAGHDTSSSTISWLFYLLHRHPGVHAKVVEELNTVFGRDTPASSSSTASKIRTDPHLLNRLPYTTAVIKETLRLFPLASTIRFGSPSVTITDPSDQSTTRYPTAHFHVWPVAHAIHRNTAYFPDPTAFVPERHLDLGESSPFPDAKSHRDALRPFEKGPRHCIGMELAMMEIRVVVAVVAREFDFEAVYPDGGAEVDGHRCYQILKGTAKPKEGLPGKVRRR